MKTVSMPPYAPTLMESTRSIGYQFEAAIADIVDNSITAKASSIDIFFFPTGESYIAVLDNGHGMNSDELDQAMRYGSQSPNSKRPINDLGRFGLGLKTASLSQCKTLTVVTKQNENIEARQWDIGLVEKTGDWSLKVLEDDSELNTVPCISKLKALKSGTLVAWQNLDRLTAGESDMEKAMGKKMAIARSHLSLVYHRYISGEPGLDKIQISINNLPITPADPFLSHRNTQIMADEHILIEGSEVIVRPYILPHISNMDKSEVLALGGAEGLKNSQGFYVYRNKRLIVSGTWFRLMRKGELSKLARVQVDIPNDLDSLWALDIKKSKAYPPEIVRKGLITIIEKLAEKSKRAWEYRGKRESSESVIHIWNRYKGKNGGFYYLINRSHPLVEKLIEKQPECLKGLEALLKTIEGNIPLNQLYIDLMSDQPSGNENEAPIEDVENILMGLIEDLPSNRSRNELLSQLLKAEPFSKFPELKDRFKLREVT